MRTTMTVGMAVAAAGLVALAGGCGKKASEKTAEKMAEMALQAQTGGKADVQIDGEKMTIQSKDGSMNFSAGGDASIPEDFPEDVYVDRGAKVLMSMRNPGGYVLNLQTSEAVDGVVQSYRREMGGQGWTEEADMNMGGQRMLMFKKEDRRASVTVARQGDITQVMVSLVKDGG
jgi:hypothetical protein